MDPYKVITSYSNCPFNHRKSKLDSYKLGVLWSYIHNDRNLNGAHDILVDAMAWMDVIMLAHFAQYISEKKSIQSIGEIFSKTQQNELKKKKKMDLSEGVILHGNSRLLTVILCGNWVIMIATLVVLAEPRSD